MSSDGIQDPNGNVEQKSFIRRHPLGCAGCGCLTLLLVVGLAIGGGMWGVMSLVKSSDAYKLSLAQARQSPALRQALGQPLVPAWLVTGSVKVENDNGTAHLQYELTGPKGSAQLTVDAQRAQGEWHLQVLQAKLAAGKVLDLLQEAGSGAGK